MLSGVVWTVDGCGNIGDICGTEAWRVLLITREGVSYHSTIEPNELLQETGTPRTSAIFDQTSTTSIPHLEWVLESLLSLYSILNPSSFCHRQRSEVCISASHKVLGFKQ